MDLTLLAALLWVAGVCLCSARAATADRGEDRLLARVREARRMALARLLERRSLEGTWDDPCELYALCGSLYIIMLRTTGLIERPGSSQEECLLVRHIINQVNPDGGFYKFPGSPSCKTITRVALVALHLVLGGVEPGPRPSSWFRRNEEIDQTLEGRIRAAIARAEHFLEEGKTKTSLAFDLDHKLLERLLLAHVGPRQSLPLIPFLEPEVEALEDRSALVAGARRQFSRVLRKALPALSILYRKAQQRSRVWGGALRLLHRLPVFRRLQERSIECLARRIHSEQDECGGWFYNAIHTMLNVMALCEAGAATDDPAVSLAHQHLRDGICHAGDGGTFVSAMSSDVWNTSHAVYSYLRAPGHSAMDAEIRQSVEFLLQWQAQDGGYAWGSGSRNHCDTDSTAFVLRPLVLAAATADGQLRSRIERALERGLAYVLPRQSRRGGFSVWDETASRCRPGSCGFLKQALFDIATADQTGRIVQGLAALGLTTAHQQIRRALRFLLKTQCRNGAWWSRWWAGYIVGSDTVLGAYGKLGLRCGPNPHRDDRLLARSHEAMMKAVDFLVEHQNADGGWGETIQSDSDIRCAGVGESTPLQTAYTLSALLGCGYPTDDPVIRDGIEYLLRTMTPDGQWADNQATFTLFARTFYYSYPFTTYVLPLDALTDYLRASGAEERITSLDTALAAAPQER